VCRGLYVRYRLVLSNFNETRQVFENLEMSNSIKISAVVVEMSYAEGLTDRHTQTAGQKRITKTIHAFRNFAEASGKRKSFFATKP
jgi:hypothetical protein